MKILVRNAVERRAGYLYFIDGKGNLCCYKMEESGQNKKSLQEKEVKRI